ncbi:MAG: hypothetical protein QOD59_3957 [Mycobacterium sp.]|jgi:hypothetical protein|nr:hypothetical protein [Mycobacterium sp.]
MMHQPSLPACDDRRCNSAEHQHKQQGAPRRGGKGMLLPMVFVAIWDTHVTRATAIAGGKSSASAECAPPLSCMDDHANTADSCMGSNARSSALSHLP